VPFQNSRRDLNSLLDHQSKSRRWGDCQS